MKRQKRMQPRPLGPPARRAPPLHGPYLIYIRARAGEAVRAVRQGAKMALRRWFYFKKVALLPVF